MNQQSFLREVGQRLAQARKNKRITQEQLAEAVDLHRTYIGFVEQGIRNPSIGNIYKVAKILKINLRDLFKGL